MWNHIAICRFKKRSVVTMCAPDNEQSRALPLEYELTNVHGSLCAKDDVSQERQIVEDWEQEKTQEPAFTTG